MPDDLHARMGMAEDQYPEKVFCDTHDLKTDYQIYQALAINEKIPEVEDFKDFMDQHFYHDTIVIENGEVFPEYEEDLSDETVSKMIDEIQDVVDDKINKDPLDITNRNLTQELNEKVGAILYKRRGLVLKKKYTIKTHQNSHLFYVSPHLQIKNPKQFGDFLRKIYGYDLDLKPIINNIIRNTTLLLKRRFSKTGIDQKSKKFLENFSSSYHALQKLNARKHMDDKELKFIREAEKRGFLWHYIALQKQGFHLLAQDEVKNATYYIPTFLQDIYYKKEEVSPIRIDKIKNCLQESYGILEDVPNKKFLDYVSHSLISSLDTLIKSVQDSSLLDDQQKQAFIKYIREYEKKVYILQSSFDSKKSL